MKKTYDELKISSYKELIEEVYFFLKDNKLIPISENVQNLDKDFYYKTEQLVLNKSLTEEEKAELDYIFTIYSSKDELFSFLAGVFLSKSVFECLYKLNK